MNRRRFILGAASLLAAPAIVPVYARLMPVHAVLPVIDLDAEFQKIADAFLAEIDRHHATTRHMLDEFVRETAGVVARELVARPLVRQFISGQIDG